MSEQIVWAFDPPLAAGKWINMLEDVGIETTRQEWNWKKAAKGENSLFIYVSCVVIRKKLIWWERSIGDVTQPRITIAGKRKPTDMQRNSEKESNADLLFLLSHFLWKPLRSGFTHLPWEDTALEKIHALKKVLLCQSKGFKNDLNQSSATDTLDACASNFIPFTVPF